MPVNVKMILVGQYLLGKKIPQENQKQNTFYGVFGVKGPVVSSESEMEAIAHCYLSFIMEPGCINDN